MGHRLCRSPDPCVLELKACRREDRRSRKAAVLDDFHKRRLRNPVEIVALLGKSERAIGHLRGKVVFGTNVNEEGKFNPESKELVREILTAPHETMVLAATYGHVPGDAIRGFHFLNEASGDLHRNQQDDANPFIPIPRR